MFYEINKFTLAILPNGRNGSIIYEGNKVIHSNFNPVSLIKKNCLINGCTYIGRLKSAEFLTGYKYKTPILIKEEGNLIFFPTNSPRIKNCAWICLNNVAHINLLNRGTDIVFLNKIFLHFDISFYILNNQYLRAVNLEAKLRKNKV